MYLLLFSIILFILSCLVFYKYKPLKEPMIGYCASIMPSDFNEKNNTKNEATMPVIVNNEATMPYHIKEVTTNNANLAPKDKKDSIETSRILKKKIRAIRKSLEDKATWEYNKINSYSKYSPTLPNDLTISENVFYLDKVEFNDVNPVLTQFDTIKNSDKTPSYYVAPKNYHLFNEYGFKTYY